MSGANLVKINAAGFDYLWLSSMDLLVALQPCFVVKFHVAFVALESCRHCILDAIFHI